MENALDLLRVVYIHFEGETSDGLNVYHFLLTETPEDVFAEGWGEIPACNIQSSLMLPPDDQYSFIKEWKTNIKLNLAQNNCCCSFQDCRDDCVALAYENIDEYEEYPEPLRFVWHYGQLMSDIDAELAQRNMKTRFITKESQIS